MILEDITFINKKGMRVTDSLIIREEFGIRQHAKVIRSIKRIIERDNRLMEESEEYNATMINGIRDLFLETTYQVEVGSCATREERNKLLEAYKTLAQAVYKDGLNNGKN